jgi:hypothetical protein
MVARIILPGHLPTISGKTVPEMRKQISALTIDVKKGQWQPASSAGFNH